MKTVNIVVACSASKTRQPEGLLAARSLPLGDLGPRIIAWLQRLEACAASRDEWGTVESLYKGQHWSAVREIRELGAQRKVYTRIWIASAGLGLVRWGATVPAYAATFAPNEQDSVSADPNFYSRRTESRTWWKSLSACDPLNFETPRSLSALAVKNPRTPLIIAVSSSYLDALVEDVLDAANCLFSPSLLSILSAGQTMKNGPLAPFLLHADARFQQELGGSLGSLSARILGFLVCNNTKLDFSCRSLRQILERKAKRLAPYVQPARPRPPLREIREFIVRELALDAKATHSNLLRRFRDSGLGCERTKFRDLFQEVKNTSHAS